MNDLLLFSEVQPQDLHRVGGKGLSLGLMLTGGLAVPPGFVVCTSAYKRLHHTGLRADPALLQQVLEAYRSLGSGLVAVRSSATAEDGSETSFAGQQDTFLGVQGEAALVQAIEACWKSLHTDRAKAYRQQQGLADEALAMAVVVQQLVQAEVAGVLFTRDPQDPAGQRISVEAAWGLGEAVVSGKVTPDRYLLNFSTGEVLSRVAGQKHLEITAEGERLVSGHRASALCLNDIQLQQLAELARKVEEFYQAPRDVEWAIAEGQVYLLQARPITTATAADREELRQQIIQQVKLLAEPRGTVWASFNLSEVIPEPTPMTWSVLQRLLGADGGFGAMNRDLGGSPDAKLGSLSAFDLIAGRPMCNLTRLPRMQFANPPIEYPFHKLKADPVQALNPRPVLNSFRDGVLGLLRLPITLWRLTNMQTTTRKLVDRYHEKFTQETLPSFKLACRTAMLEDWSKKTPEELLKLFQEWTERTLVEFARESLKPTVLANLCWDTLQEVLKPRVKDDINKVMGELAQDAEPPSDCNYADGIFRLSQVKLTLSAFLEQYGHRCRNEMELAQPRWSEDPAAVERLKTSPKLGTSEARDLWPELIQKYKLGPHTRTAARRWADKLRIYLGLREAAKHHLLMGYALIRRALVELGQRTGLRDGIFFLTREQLPNLLTGHDFAEVVRQRKKQRQRELSLELPAVLFSDDLEAIGRAVPVPPGLTSWSGVALSAGVAQAKALVLREPVALPPDEPYVLVCPSTDPAWVPLFAGAKALIMETGGVLSHGAIVAREFGLPAVAGLPGILQQVQSGELLRVDGGTGTVVRTGT